MLLVLNLTLKVSEKEWVNADRSRKIPIKGRFLTLAKTLLLQNNYKIEDYQFLGCYGEKENSPYVVYKFIYRTLGENEKSDNPPFVFNGGDWV